MEKNHMHQLTQTLYGVVIGVSFFNFGNENINDVIEPNGQFFFNAFFFLLTFLIAIHDWFIYHRNQIINKPGFAPYLAQIGSVLFIGLMFNTCSVARMEYWYLMGGIYTVFNWFNIKNAIHQDANISKKWLTVSYVIHLAIAVSVIIWLTLIPYQPEIILSIESDSSIQVEITGRKILALIITAIVVISIWIIRDSRKKTLPVTILIRRTLTAKNVYPYNFKMDQLDSQKDFTNNLETIIKLKIIDLITKNGERYKDEANLKDYFNSKKKFSQDLKGLTQVMNKINNNWDNLIKEKDDLIAQLIG